MKKKLNIITFLIGVSVGVSLWSFLKENFYDEKESFMEGRKMAPNTNTYQSDMEHFETLYLTLAPKNFLTMPDSIYNERSGEWIPARTIHTKVYIGGGDGPGMHILWMVPFAIAAIVGLIMIVFNLSKIIYAVNKSIIFEWINVRRLRRIGIGFSLFFILDVIIRIYERSRALNLIDISNYQIVNSSFDGSLLLFGMIAFLVAEIFAVGLRLKEEQDLTI